MVYSREEILKLIKEFRKAIEEIIHTDKIILFGSYVSGTPQEYSDIDIAVVSSDITDENYFDFKIRIFKKAMEFDSSLEPLCFSKEEFDNDWLPIIPEIKRTGIEVKI